MPHSINTRYNLFNTLPEGQDPSPEWLVLELRHCFGTLAERNDPPLRFFARYRYTADYADYACVAGFSEDVLPIEGPGLEVIVQKPWNVVKSNRQMQIVKGRLLVKEHSPERDRIKPFFDIFRSKWFQDATLTNIASKNEEASGAPMFSIAFNVYQQNNWVGGREVIR